MKLIRLLIPLAMLFAPALVNAEDPTPEYSGWMKEIAANNGKINKGVELQASAQRMSELMKNVAGFWASRDAAVSKLASDASTAAANLASGTGDAEANKATIGAACRGCHPVHREGPNGGPYQIK